MRVRRRRPPAFSVTADLARIPCCHSRESGNPSVRRQNGWPGQARPWQVVVSRVISSCHGRPQSRPSMV